MALVYLCLGLGLILLSIKMQSMLDLVTEAVFLRADVGACAAFLEGVTGSAALRVEVSIMIPRARKPGDGGNVRRCGSSPEVDGASSQGCSRQIGVLRPRWVPHEASSCLCYQHRRAEWC